MSRIADPRDVLIAPVISEKSYGLLDEGKYTFEVRPDANKTQIRQAVESVFGVRWSYLRGTGPCTTPPPVNCGARVEP